MYFYYTTYKYNILTISPRVNMILLLTDFKDITQQLVFNDTPTCNL